MSAHNQESLEVVYSYNTHPDEPLPSKVAELLQDTAIQTYEVHPEAALQGVRYIGEGPDVMSSNPNPDGNPQERAMDAYLHWLGRRRGNPNVVVIDGHSSPNPAARYCQVGPKVSRAALAAAVQLGYKYCLLDSLPFHVSVPNGGATEEPVASEADLPEIAQKQAEALRRLAAGGIQALLEQPLKGITVVRKHTIFVAPHSYTDAGATIQDPGVRRELEAMPPQPPFSRLELDPELCRRLGLPETGRVLYGSGHYHNATPLVPELGELVRAAFGYVLVEGGIQKQSPDGKWLHLG
jgi:hypothetical protein